MEDILKVLRERAKGLPESVSLELEKAISLNRDPGELMSFVTFARLYYGLRMELIGEDALYDKQTKV